MKRMISLLLAVVICFGLCTGFASTVSAETESDDYIYYSDLFWVYPSVLKRVYLPERKTNTNYALLRVMNEYTFSNDYKAAAIEQDIDTLFSPEEWVKIVSDAIGGTNFKYNEQLDRANYYFATAISEICVKEIKNVSSGTVASKAIAGILDVLHKISQLEEDLEKDSLGLQPTDIFTYLYDSAMGNLRVYCPEVEVHFGALRNQMQKTVADDAKLLKNLSKIVELVESTIFFIAVYEMQGDLVDEILATQPKESTLYKGLSRIKQQQTWPVISYLSSKFITDGIFEEVGTLANDLLKEAVAAQFDLSSVAISAASTSIAVIKLLNFAIFDVLWPVDYSDYTTTCILHRYAMDFYDSIETSITQIENNCTYQKVKSFEKLFTAYGAATKAAYDAALKLAEHNNTCTKAWLEKEISKYYIDEAYEIYIIKTKQYLQSCTEEERAFFMRAPYALTAGVVAPGTDTPTNGFIYTGKGQTFTTINLGFAKELVVLENADIVVDGNVTMSHQTKLHNCGKLKINGNVTMNGEQAPRTTFINDGITEIVGNLSEKQGAYVDNCVTSNTADSVLYVGGNIDFYGKKVYQIKEGKLILNGTQPQHLNNVDIYNMDVQNEKGIVLDRHIYVRGEFDLNGYPSDSQKFWMFIYEGAEFDPDSVYPNALVAERLFLNQKVTFNKLAMTCASSLTVGGKGDVTVLDEMRVGYEYIEYIDNNLNRPATTGTRSHGPFSIINWGKLTVNGNLNLKDGSASSKSTLLNNGFLHVKGNVDNKANGSFALNCNFDDSVFRVGGDVILKQPIDYEGTKGTLILDGAQKQNVNIAKATRLYIENESADGVVFNNAINVTTLFDHKGNQFSLYNNGTGSTFVDYDGDGMKDNVDPQPTVGNPCTILVSSENEEYGSVSTDRIDVMGGTTVTISATPAERHKFTKWVDANGNTVSTKPEYTFLVTGSIELIAVFDRVRTVQEDYDGDGIIDYTFSAHIYGTTYRLFPAYKPRDKEYTYEFLGWATSPDGEVVYGTEVTETAPVTEDMQLYAKFKPVPIRYIITFRTLGGSEVEEMKAGYNGVITLPAATREGYAFLGWAETAEGDTTILKAGTSYTVTGAKILYAQWEEITLRGDVNLDGDVNAADLTKLARHVAEIEFISDTSALANAEVTGDGEITAADLTKMARYVAEIIIDWDQE